MNTFVISLLFAMFLGIKLKLVRFSVQRFLVVVGVENRCFSTGV